MDMMRTDIDSDAATAKALTGWMTVTVRWADHQASAIIHESELPDDAGVLGAAMAVMIRVKAGATWMRHAPRVDRPRVTIDWHL